LEELTKEVAEEVDRHFDKMPSRAETDAALAKANEISRRILHMQTTQFGFKDCVKNQTIDDEFIHGSEYAHYNQQIQKLREELGLPSAK